MIYPDKMEPIREDAQLTQVILMIVPSMFGLNTETNIDNTFQPKTVEESPEYIRDMAMQEFQTMTEVLRHEGIGVVVCPSRDDGVITPDAVFPNNWISFHKNRIVLYPMKTPNRRAERQLGSVQNVLEQSGKKVENPVLDLSYLEDEGKIVEGTGSLVLDRVAKVAFANLSERTKSEAVEIFCQETGYEAVCFTSRRKDGGLIYHTNVMMSVGDEFAVVCKESIVDPTEQEKVLSRLDQLNKEVIEISEDQMNHFCGNILQVKSSDGQNRIVMSESAFNRFTPEQLATLEKYGKCVPVSIATIEKIGGGSARCMMAEVFGTEDKD